MKKLLVFFTGNFATGGSVGLNLSADSKSNLRYLPSNTRRALFRRTAKKIFATIVLCTIVGSAANAQAVKVLSNGNVGIGTSNPAYSLDVFGKNNTIGSRNFRVTFPQGGNLTNTEFSALAYSSYAGYAGGNGWTAMYAKAGSASRAGIFDGNVFITDSLGIGRPNPAYRLDVYGTSRFGDAIIGDVIVGNYIACFGFSYPAIYGTNDRLLLGTPSNWVYTTFSKNVYYDFHGKVEERPINLCLSQVLEPVKYINSWKIAACLTKGSTEEQIEYVFNPVELKAIFPYLVTTYDTCDDGKPKYAINYAGMTPILTAAINEQQGIIDTQQETINQQQREVEMLQTISIGQERDLCELRQTVSELREIVSRCCKEAGAIPITRQDSTSNKNNLLQDEAILYQNTPNPFSSNTEISCYVPAITNNAFIYVYNLQGTELMSFPILQSGFSTVTIYASALPAGMYLYTLVVDNIIIDSKRMILTK